MRAAELRQAGVPVVTLPVHSFRSLSMAQGILQLRRYLKRQAIVLVHAFDPPAAIFSAPASWLFRVPVVLSSQRGERGFFSRATQTALRVTDRFVDGIVVNSDFVRQELQQRYRLPPALLHLCYNGLNSHAFHARNRKRPPELADAEAVIGCVAVLRVEKSIETLLRAVALLKTEHPKVQVLITGSGECGPALQAEAVRLGIAERCLFIPAAADVAPWYRAIDIFVLPSLTEAFSNSLMEAMACGCCPVASRVGGNLELIREGEDGLLFEPADASGLAAKLDQLLRDKELRARLTAAAGRRIEEAFTIEASARRMGELYESFLQGAG